jgi:hypothetical protein
MKSILLVLFLSAQMLYAQQGIKGKVEWISGNQMPGPGKTERNQSKAQAVTREISIYEATTTQQATSQGGVFYTNISTKLIKTIKSKKDGRFCIKLPPGDYSVFVKEKDGLFANQFDGNGRIQCITVKKGEYATLNILINYEAAY